MISSAGETEEVVTEERWKAAQSYERAHWQKLADNIARSSGNKLRWYRWKAGELEKFLKKHARSADPARESVLEVGSGPIGIVNYLSAEEAVALDPLMDFYDQKPSLVELRSEGVRFVSSRGEEMPFEDDKFSLVIIDNVIDHTHEPNAVMAEIHRVLRPGGYLYFTVNIHGRWGVRMRKVIEFLHLDEGHPHSYTPRKAQELITESGLVMAHEETENPWCVIWANVRSTRLRDKTKVVLGVCEYVYTALAQKPSGKNGPA
jgi:SAM-dependent methyltransferase